MSLTSILSRALPAPGILALLFLSVACGAPREPGRLDTDVAEEPLSSVRLPDTVYGDWHENFPESTEDQSVFVPLHVDLGPARYRRSLHLGRDGSFSTLILDPADAHYTCPGTFIAVSAERLRAECKDPKTHATLRLNIQILETRADRLLLRISPARPPLATLPAPATPESDAADAADSVAHFIGLSDFNVHCD